MHKTSIIILTYNNLEYTKGCLESIQKYTEEGTYELIIIDNHSTDQTVEWLKKQKNLKVIYNEENLGFPKGCNQGIQLASKENDILLLNNDTIVTANWLKNLQTCLYSDASIGAVGPTCNQDENLQGSDFTYETFSEMQEKALKNNISDPNRWEEKVFLIGFCLLIKREVINKIKTLDEAYTPGYIEDNDLCLRILKENYRLILCHDVFIHHYLGTAFRKNLNTFYPILNKNREYFLDKWGFSSFAFDEIKDASLKILEPTNHVLDWQCGLGANALKIKYIYKNIQIDGVEKDMNKAIFAQKFIPVFKEEELPLNTYDVILIGQILEETPNPKEFLAKISTYLKEGGMIIGEIENASSIKNIDRLLKGEAYQNKNHFTIEDIERLFKELNYTQKYIFSWYIVPNEEEQKLIDKLNEIEPKNYQVTYYSFRFQK